MIAYIHTLVAAWDLQQGNLNQAITRAEEALEADQEVNDSNELILAWMMVIPANCQLGNLDQAKQDIVVLQPFLLDYTTNFVRANGGSSLPCG